ncbi:Uncharacterised protein [Bordetella pertussis]|nr:Uncharacterised protein [Bordetella pertussis]
MRADSSSSPMPCRAGSWRSICCNWWAAPLRRCWAESCSPSSASRMREAPSSSDWACDSRVCSVCSASHSSGPSPRRSSSSDCHCRRSRSAASASASCSAVSSWRASARHCFQACATVWRSSACPPWASSRSRWASGRIRLWWACWPWMSTSPSPSSRNWAIVAGMPLM